MSDTANLPPEGGYASRMTELGAVLDRIAEVEKRLATLAGRRAELVEAARRLSVAHAAASAVESSNLAARSWDPAVVAHRELISELSCILRIPERTAGSLLETSRALINDLPATHAALRAGEVSYRHSQVMVDHASSLPIESIPAFEAAVLPAARRVTVSKFDRTARMQRERQHPESITVRAARSRADRAVTCDAGRDGMAWLTAFLPADIAMAAYARLTDIAMSLDTAEESRSLSQRRADVLSDLLIDGVTDPEMAPSDGSHAVRLVPVSDGEPLSEAEDDVLRATQAGLFAETGDTVDLETLAAGLVTPSVRPPTASAAPPGHTGLGSGGVGAGNPRSRDGHCASADTPRSVRHPRDPRWVWADRP